MKAAGAAFLSLVWLAGCEHAINGRVVPPSLDRIDFVHVIVPVSPLRAVGEGPGANAVAMEIFFEKAGQGGGQPVTGAIDVLFYEGKVSPEDLGSQKPFHVESFPTSRLKAMEGIGRMGVSYRGIVPWGEKSPPSPMITIAVRYVAPGGPAVVSAPTVVPLQR